MAGEECGSTPYYHDRGRAQAFWDVEGRREDPRRHTFWRTGTPVFCGTTAEKRREGLSSGYHPDSRCPPWGKHTHLIIRDVIVNRERHLKYIFVVVPLKAEARHEGSEV